MKKNTIIQILVLVIVTIGISVGVTLWLHHPKPIIIKEDIKDILELATTETTLSSFKIQEYDKDGDRTTNSNKATGYVVVYIQGEVRGSLDLEKMKMAVDGNQVTINFERNSIHISNFAETKTDDVICEKPSVINLWKKPDRSEINNLKNDLKDSFLDENLRKEIVEKTMDNVEKFLSSFIGKFGYTVVIFFDDNAYDPNASIQE